ncbi:PREDICTED: uncharacterized protein LOC108536652 [Rhinopithecus bieti]|uniref:uncharacterized protein LOC108536652 n=1 Tax=Rhinopithecus bieti TaxID=61621 RepID=UPI00083BDBB1|nr:PREDICTED: uncharacterized protein LOC108536652 [Rhinopithecus bieti]
MEQGARPCQGGCPSVLPQAGTAGGLSATSAAAGSGATPLTALQLRTVPGRACYASRCCGSRRRPPRHRALRGLLLFCLWLPSDRLALPLATPLSELHAQSSGVEQLPEEFRQQPDDSLAADTSFLRVPLAVLGWRQCGAACCSKPRCSVAVVELPRRTAPLAAALGCYLFNCTARGRNICRPRAASRGGADRRRKVGERVRASASPRLVLRSRGWLQAPASHRGVPGTRLLTRGCGRVGAGGNRSNSSRCTAATAATTSAAPRTASPRPPHAPRFGWNQGYQKGRSE